MEKMIRNKYITDNVILIKGDTFRQLRKLEEKSVHLIFADPPYFLSSGSITCKSGKMVSVNKGDWDKSKETMDKHRFNRRWIKLSKTILKDNGTIFISGTMHNIYSIGMALEQEGFKILNNITWQKTNPPPNLSCKMFTHSTETVLWARKIESKEKNTFNYLKMKEENGGKQMKDVWTSSLTKPSEKNLGKHPTQKPLFLLDRIIRAASNEGDLVLDPFCGSGTTGVAAVSLNRRFIGIEKEKKYIDLTIKRLENIK